MMTLWTAVHLGVSPASKTISDLSEWQLGLIYETAMNFSIESMRHGYYESKKSVTNLDDADILDMGYTPEEIAAIKGYK